MKLKKSKTAVEDSGVDSHFKRVDVLDKGFIELIDSMYVDPMLKIVNSARVSFNKESTELTEKDEKLIEYLWNHEHFSTFRHSYFTFRWKAPLFVWRQAWKYQIGSDYQELETSGYVKGPETNWNEVSGRYIEFSPEFYYPVEIRKQSKSNKQGSDGVLQKKIRGYDAAQFLANTCEYSYECYKALVDAGAAKEQARMILPQNVYSTCIWTVSLQGLLYFLHQRCKEDAQWEIRQYALALKDIMKPIMPKIIDMLECDMQQIKKEN